jgi:hypothetical protein
MMTNFPVPPYGAGGVAPTNVAVAGGARPGGFQTPVAFGGAQQTYRADTFGKRMGQLSRQSFGPALPLNYLANDWRLPVNYVALRIERKLNSLGVHNTQDLLKRANTPFKRSMLATMVASFDRQVDKNMATQWINYWLGQSDLLRTGMQIDTARLLQRSGINDVPSLARYWAPFDRLALYGTLTTNALRFGYRMPSWGEFSASLDAARSLPWAVRW